MDLLSIVQAVKDGALIQSASWPYGFSRSLASRLFKKPKSGRCKRELKWTINMKKESRSYIP